ncbi:MAG: hypothetical protein ABIO17_08970 [Pseudoxanthomonas sp.]
MSRTLFRNACALPSIALVLLSLAGCATPSGGDAGSQPQEQARVHTVILARGQQAVIAAESLSVKLTDINDSRCPAKVACVWAGHAAVTLQVSKPGLAPATLSIGTQAPAGMELPYEASYGGVQFHLLALETGDGTLPAPRATIRIARP